MKIKLGIPDGRPWADFLPTITIKAKDFANEITNINVRTNELKSENDIASEHVKNNKDVRNLLQKSGIIPEKLPPEEDIKKLKQRVKSTEKLIPKNTEKLNRWSVGLGI